MIQIPKISLAIQRMHGGENAGVVNGKVVAYGKTSVAIEREAVKKGYKPEDIMFIFISKPNTHYAL